MKFQDVLKNEREKRGWNQARLATELSVAPSTVGMWEQGRRMPPFEKLEEIADLFNISMDKLRGSTKSDDNEETTIHTIAAHATKDLTEEEAEKIIEYAKFLKSQRKK